MNPAPPPHPVEMPFGRIEKIALAAAIVWLVLSYFAPTSIFRTLTFGILLASGIVAAGRGLRRLIRHSIWRLRNRLLLSYLFIAVVPVLLLFSLAWIGAWALAGQTAAYLVTAEFNRNMDVLNDSAAAIASSEAPPVRMMEFLTSRYPGIQYLRDSADAPARSGVTIKEGKLYATAHHRTERGSVTILAPLTKKFLSTLIPNLGEVSLLGDEDGMKLHDPGPGDPVRMFPAAINLFDVQVLWGTSVNVSEWGKKAAEERLVFLAVHTRISQVFRVIFSQKADWDQPLLISAFYGFAVLFLFFEFIALVIGISITRTMTGAVHELYEGTQRIQAGDFSTRIPVKGKDQMADLSSSFNTMTENLEKLLVVAKENERVQADIAIAREVQEQLYPRTVPPSKHLVLTAKLNPARSVSGDYYDYQRIDGNRIALAMGDVAGKGISAAILMANVQSTLRASIRHACEIGQGCSTSLIVSQLNKHLHAHTTPEKYATFYFGVYDEESGQLTSTNAGHLPPLLFRRGQVTPLDVNGMVVGAFALAKYDETTVQLEKDDLLVLYTDGISEPENEYGEMFGEERLIETIQRFIDRPNEEIIAEVFKAVEQWIHAPDSNDDMTILLVRRIA